MMVSNQDYPGRALAQRYDHADLGCLRALVHKYVRKTHVPEQLVLRIHRGAENDVRPKQVWPLASGLRRPRRDARSENNLGFRGLGRL